MSACCGPEREAASGTPKGPAVASGTGSLPGVGDERQRLECLAGPAPRQLQLVGLPGGTFRRGSEDSGAYPEDGEGPVVKASVEPFAIGATTVTNAEFAVFVVDTGYRTDAERHGDSLVFSRLLPQGPRDRSPAVSATPWWRQVDGACWFRPEGPGSSVDHRADHPVTHVSRFDADAYARWVGARLPTETEWEYAARGGLDQQPYPWGNVMEPSGQPRMNVFTGEFPDQPHGPVGTEPASSFPPNAYGLYNMTGNVWEWTSSRASAGDARPVLRGGSYMCHASYCRRYRTSARTFSTADTSLGHTGFRLALTTGQGSSVPGLS